MKTIAYLCLGLILVASSLYLHNGTFGVSSADRQRCEQAVRDFYEGSEEALSTLLPKCDEPGMVAMMDARADNSDAGEAAQAIASANRGGIASAMFSYLLLGAGIGAFGAAFVSWKKRANA